MQRQHARPRARVFVLGLCYLAIARGLGYYPRLASNPDICPHGDWLYSPDTGKCYGLVDGKIDATATAAAAEARYYALTWKQCETECEKFEGTLVSYQTRKEWKMLKKILGEWNNVRRRRLESPLMPSSPIPTATPTITPWPTLDPTTVQTNESMKSLRIRQLYDDYDGHGKNPPTVQKTSSPTIDAVPTPATVTRGSAPTSLQAYIGAYKDENCVWRWTSGGKFYEDEFAWSTWPRGTDENGWGLKECARMGTSVAYHNKKTHGYIFDNSCTSPDQAGCFCEYSSTSAGASARLLRRPTRDPEKSGRQAGANHIAECACDYSKWAAYVAGSVISFSLLLPVVVTCVDKASRRLEAQPQQFMVAGQVTLVPRLPTRYKREHLFISLLSGVGVGVGLVLHTYHAQSHCRYSNGRKDLLQVGWLMILIGAAWQGCILLWYQRLNNLHRMNIRRHGDGVARANHEDSLDASASLVRLDPNAPWKWRIKLQTELTPDDLVRMVRPEAISAELVKELELASTPGGVACIICNGTGVTKGTQAEASALNAEKRNHLKVLRSLSSINSDSDTELDWKKEGSWFYVTELGWKAFDGSMNAVIEEAYADGNGAKVEIRTQHEHTEIDLTSSVMKVTNYSRDPPAVRLYKIKRLCSGTMKLRCALFFDSFGRRLGALAASGSFIGAGAAFVTNVMPGKWNLLIRILIGATVGCFIGAGICMLCQCFFVATMTIGTLGVEKEVEQGLTAGRWYFEDGEGRWVAYDEATSEALEQAYTDLAEPNQAHPRILRKEIRISGPQASYLVNLERMVQRSREYGGIIQRVRRVVVPLMPGQDTKETALDASTIDLQVPESPCWLCNGSGRTSQWLSGFQVPTQITGSASETRCLVCYDEVGEYGLSTECNHFYCKGCIKGSLDMIVNTGQFPAFCPQCRADAPGGKPVTGRIQRPALTFLEHRGIIDKEYQFRFVSAQQKHAREEALEYFPCPGPGCGRFIEVEPKKCTFRIVEKAGGGFEAKLRVGRCECGNLVCCVCKQLCESVNHECPKNAGEKDGVSVAARAAEDASTLALLSSIGKACPCCGNFIEKNEGCDVMMCGDSAHGYLAKALQNGGCGASFKWSTLKLHNGDFYDLDGRKQSGQVKTARQIPIWPKCAREGCPYLRCSDSLGGVQGRAGGGEYCCSNCRDSLGGHSLFCHKILADEKGGKGNAAAAVLDPAPGADDDDLFVPTFFFPEVLQNIGRIRLSWLKTEGPLIHVAFVGQRPNEDSDFAVVKPRQILKRSHLEENIEAEDASIRQKGVRGVNGGFMVLEFAFSGLQNIIGVKSDSGLDRPFTVHFCESDNDEWQDWTPWHDPTKEHGVKPEFLRQVQRCSTGGSSQSASTGKVSLLPGIRVQARWRGYKKSYPGTIKKANSDGTYDIAYDDGHTERGAKFEFIQPTGEWVYLPGTKVKAQRKGLGKWYPGRIKYANENGTYAIDYDDGYHEYDVKNEFIRPQAGFTGPPWLLPGTKIEARWKGGAVFYPGTIQYANSDGTFDIAYDKKPDGTTECIQPHADSKTVQLFESGSGSGSSGGSSSSGKVNWQPFDVTFEVKQPLLLQLKGVQNHNDRQEPTNHWFVVTGFARSDENPLVQGPAEAKGTIKAMDIIVGCNGVDISNMTFEEGLSVIRDADWPKTLHFIRDASANDSASVLEEGSGSAGS